MKVVIDIPDVAYDWFRNGFPDRDDGEEAVRAIANGKPLPKGHGRLIDEDELLLKLKCWDAKAHGIPNYVFRSIKLTYAVIEADKTESEK